MTQTFKKSFIIAITFISFSASAQTAAPSKNLFEGLDYPELQVAPRASERLQSLSKWEQDSGILSQWTLLTSGTLTFMAALQAQGSYQESVNTPDEKQSVDLAVQTGQVIGLAWIGIASYLIYQKPAQRGFSGIQKMSKADRRSDLSRERYAEEILESQADLQNKLEKLAIGTNLLVSLSLLSNMTDDKKPYGVISLLGSTLPWLFDSEYSRQYEKHLDSKRKIYSPLVMMNYEPQNQGYEMTLNWSF